MLQLLSLWARHTNTTTATASNIKKPVPYNQSLQVHTTSSDLKFRVHFDCCRMLLLQSTCIVIMCDHLCVHVHMHTLYMWNIQSHVYTVYSLLSLPFSSYVSYVRVVCCIRVYVCACMYISMYVHLHVCITTCAHAVVEVVPHLNSVLSRMVTQLGAIRHENMQWVFSYG